MVKVARVEVAIPANSYADPDSYSLTAHFNFSEAQITVRCIDEQTGEERRTTVQFDSSEVLKEQLVAAA